VVEEVEVLVLLVVQARRRFLPEAFAAGGVVEWWSGGFSV
jgi:hypothetical protein